MSAAPSESAFAEPVGWGDAADAGDVSEFELPGDAERLARMQAVEGSTPAEPEPTPEHEPEPPAGYDVEGSVAAAREVGVDLEDLNSYLLENPRVEQDLVERGLLPEPESDADVQRNALAARQAVEQIIRARESTQQAIDHGINLYEEGQYEPHVIADWLGQQYGPVVQQGFLEHWAADEADDMPPDAEEYQAALAADRQARAYLHAQEQARVQAEEQEAAAQAQALAEAEAYAGELSEAQARRLQAQIPAVERYLQMTGSRLEGGVLEAAAVAHTLEQFKTAESLADGMERMHREWFPDAGLSWLGEETPTFDREAFLRKDLYRRVKEGEMRTPLTAEASAAALRAQLDPSPREQALADGFDALQELPPAPPPAGLRGRQKVLAEQRYLREVQARESRKVRDEHIRRQAERDRTPADTRSAADRLGDQWDALDHWTKEWNI